MSTRLLGKIIRISQENRPYFHQIVRNFSKKKGIEDPYKYVKRKHPEKNETLVWKDPNFEILASSAVDFPFFLPGNVGLAWFNKQTTLRTTQHEFIMREINEKNSNGDIICNIQDCPKVLRKTVYDLFPTRNFEACDISVITISLKPNQKLMRQNKENEIEKLAQTFIIAAKSICDRIRKAGYWADFINPFSGLPYLSLNSMKDGKLYESDEKFRCLDFQIFKIDHCKVISNEQDGNCKRFTGSLFTTVPCEKENIGNIFS